MQSTILENLGFKVIIKLGRKWPYWWSWQNTFYIYTKPVSENSRFGRTKILKTSDLNFTGDKRENVLFQGSYVFDNEEFAGKLLKNIGIEEKIKGIILTEQKEVNHIEILTDLGFKEITHNTWTKNIFLISLRPPRFDTDRGKCIILKKPNNKKLMKNERPAGVVYKGRYFFDDPFFTEMLLEKIGFYLFESMEKNKTYQFNRETLADTQSYIEDEFLKF